MAGFLGSDLLPGHVFNFNGLCNGRGRCEMKFKVGDRVRVYGAIRVQSSVDPPKERWDFRFAGNSSIATVKGSNGHYGILIEAKCEYDEEVFTGMVHEKQLRRLKPKRKPREFWITGGPIDDRYLPKILKEEPNLGGASTLYIHVREVLEKKK